MNFPLAAAKTPQLPNDDAVNQPTLTFDSADYQACYDYWLGLKGDRWAPSWRRWQWENLSVNLIPYFLVVDVHYEPLDFVYRFFGTASVKMHNVDFTGKSVNEIRSPVTIKSTCDQYYEVTRRRQAIASSYTIQAGEYGSPHMQTSLRMPMSNDGEKVDQIVSFIDWRKDIGKIRDEHLAAYGQ